MELVRSVTPVDVELKEDSEAAVEQKGTSANMKSDCFTVGQNSVNDDCYIHSPHEIISKAGKTRHNSRRKRKQS